MSKLFGSNVQQRKFGLGAEISREDWICVCDHKNRYYLVKCSMCGVPKSTAKEYSERKQG